MAYEIIILVRVETVVCLTFSVCVCVCMCVCVCVPPIKDTIIISHLCLPPSIHVTHYIATERVVVVVVFLACCVSVQSNYDNNIIFYGEEYNSSR